MKLNGFVGKGTGKLGSSVFAVSGGEQIVRQYNPNVSNPNTLAQVQQRAKFKLLSQVATDMAPAVAFSKQGLKSARNRFVSKNFPFANIESMLSGDVATLDYTKLQLTDGNINMEEIEKGTGQNVKLKNIDTLELDYVVYVLAEEDEEQQLHVVAVLPLQDPTNGLFEQTYANYPTAKHVWAYGLKFNSANAKRQYQNYYLEGTDGLAYLGTQMSEATANATKTTTVYLSLE